MSDSTKRATVAVFWAVPFVLAACGSSGSVDPLQLEVPDRLIFEGAPVGRASSLTLVIGNPGVSDVQISRIIEGPNFKSADHEFTITLESMRVPTGGVVTGEVRFTPEVQILEGVESFVAFETSIGTYRVDLLGATGVRGILAEPETVDFGLVPRGGVASRSFRLYNFLGESVRLSAGFDAPGRPRVERVSGTGIFELISGERYLNGARLEPRETAFFDVRYQRPQSPLAEGDQAFLTFTACEAPECDRPILLIASSDGRGLKCEQARIDAGWLRTGAAPIEVKVRCENVSDYPIAPNAVLVGDDQITLIDSDTTLVQPRTDLELRLRLQPSAAEDEVHTATVTIASIVPGNGAFDPEVVAFGFGTSSARFDIAPAELEFGSVAVGTNFSRMLRVSNSGGGTLRVQAHGAGDFRVIPAEFEVDGGSSISVEVLFAPSMAGDRLEEIVLRSNDPDRPDARVRVSADAVDLQPCALSAPSSLDFGEVEIPRQIDRQFTLQNVGSSSCLVKFLPLSQDGSERFFFNDAGGDVFLMPSERVESTVSYAPRDEAGHASELVFYVSNPASSLSSISLSGRGSTRGVVMHPPSLDFSARPPDCLAPARSVRVTNTAFQALRIEQTSLSGVSFSTSGIATPSPSSPVVIAARSQLDFTVSAAVPNQNDRGVFDLGLEAGAAPTRLSLRNSVASEPSAAEEFSAPRRFDFLVVVEAVDEIPRGDLALAVGQAFAGADAQGVDPQAAFIGMDAIGFGCPGPPAGFPESAADIGRCGFVADGGTPAWRIVTPVTQPSPSVAIAAALDLPAAVQVPAAAFEAAERALSTPVAAAHNAGVLRPNSHLVVVFVSTRDDASPAPVDTYAQFLTALVRHRNAVSVISISGEESGCSANGVDAEAAPRLSAAARLTGGETVSICAADLAGRFERVVEGLLGRRTYFLREAAEAIERVQVAGIALTPDRFSYDPLRRALVIDPEAAPTPGDRVVVGYRISCAN